MPLAGGLAQVLDAFGAGLLVALGLVLGLAFLVVDTLFLGASRVLAFRRDAGQVQGELPLDLTPRRFVAVSGALRLRLGAAVLGGGGRQVSAVRLPVGRGPLRLVGRRAAR